MGVAVPDYPPLGMLDVNRFQGIVADYLFLLFETPPVLRQFPSRQAALTALRNGGIDLLGGDSIVLSSEPDTGYRLMLQHDPATAPG